jgi:hypothetical protein
MFLFNNHKFYRLNEVESNDFLKKYFSILEQSKNLNTRDFKASFKKSSIDEIKYYIGLEDKEKIIFSPFKPELINKNCFNCSLEKILHRRNKNKLIKLRLIINFSILIFNDEHYQVFIGFCLLFRRAKDLLNFCLNLKVLGIEWNLYLY